MIYQLQEVLCFIKRKRCYKVKDIVLVNKSPVGIFEEKPSDKNKKIGIIILLNFI